jgi:succinate-semialdehyde dehydrogenase/glutarate-semialdehyde dehydrogenase
MLKNNVHKPNPALLIGGEWIEGSGRPFEVRNKYTGETITTINSADDSQVSAAVTAARRAFSSGAIAPYNRYETLMKAAQVLGRRRGEIVDVMVAETGFTVNDSHSDFDRCVQTLLASAEEAKRVTGEMVPMEGAPGHDGELAFTVRVPLGIVCAITPFNSPLNTVAHKVAPALAAGNSVVLKPACYTPLSAAKLCEVIMEAGLPDGWLNLVFGGGADVGRALLANKDINFYAFTGGNEAGRIIQQQAGLRRTQMELGNISATIVCKDAGLASAVEKCSGTAFRKAGQVCTSLQRLYVHDTIFDEFAGRMADAARLLVVGDPRHPDTRVGPMIDEKEAERAESWLNEAVSQGAEALTGIRREGPLLWPVVLRHVTKDMRVLSQEIFAPVVSLVPFSDLDDAIDAVNGTPYGLAAGILTTNIEMAFRAARRVEVGLFNINGTSSNRADLMPYGGCKASGFGREGPRHAIRDMTDERLITITLPG